VGVVCLEDGLRVRKKSESGVFGLVYGSKIRGKFGSRVVVGV
jgi:hypothetical protein